MLETIYHVLFLPLCRHQQGNDDSRFPYPTSTFSWWPNSARPFWNLPILTHLCPITRHSTMHSQFHVLCCSAQPLESSSRPSSCALHQPNARTWSRTHTYIPFWGIANSNPTNQGSMVFPGQELAWDQEYEQSTHIRALQAPTHSRL